MVGAGVGAAPYQVIAGLFAVADDYWPTITARFYQIDLLELPLTKFLDLIWGWLREVLPGDEFDKFVYQLEAPLPGQEHIVGDASSEAEGAAFMTVMQMTGGT